MSRCYIRVRNGTDDRIMPVSLRLFGSPRRRCRGRNASESGFSFFPIPSDGWRKMPEIMEWRMTMLLLLLLLFTGLVEEDVESRLPLENPGNNTTAAPADEALVSPSQCPVREEGCGDVGVPPEVKGGQCGDLTE